MSKKCKGIYFSIDIEHRSDPEYEEGFLVPYKRITIVTIGFLKDFSCPGCDHCKNLIAFIDECGGFSAFENELMNPYDTWYEFIISDERDGVCWKTHTPPRIWELKEDLEGGEFGVYFKRIDSKKFKNLKRRVLYKNKKDKINGIL